MLWILPIGSCLLDREVAALLDFKVVALVGLSVFQESLNSVPEVSIHATFVEMVLTEQVKSITYYRSRVWEMETVPSRPCIGGTINTKNHEYWSFEMSVKVQTMFGYLQIDPNCYSELTGGDKTA